MGSPYLLAHGLGFLWQMQSPPSPCLLQDATGLGADADWAGPWKTPLSLCCRRLRLASIFQVLINSLALPVIFGAEEGRLALAGWRVDPAGSQ
jgi:hypothetical protein